MGYFGIGDIVQYLHRVTDEEVDDLFAEYAELYEFEYGNYVNEEWEASVEVLFLFFEIAIAQNIFKLLISRECVLWKTCKTLSFYRGQIHLYINIMTGITTLPGLIPHTIELF